MHTKQQNNTGIMPDSQKHIARLESKLNKLKKSDNKVTAKDLISSMNEFKEIYMRDYFKNNDQSQPTEENSIILENVNKSYLERKFLPEQPISKEETELLVENDWLLKDDARTDFQAAKEPDSDDTKNKDQ